MKRILFFLLTLMLSPAIALGYTATVPEQDIGLHPQGWVSPAGIKFEPGSQMELNEHGEVISGVLKFGEYMRSVGKCTTPLLGRPLVSNFISFKGRITFDEQGRVFSGTLSGNNDVYLIPDVESSVIFKGGTTILFDKNDNVKVGTLGYDTFLRPAGWEKFLPANAIFIKFKAETEIVFGANAQVLKGKIANDLQINGTTYPAGTTLQFAEAAYPQKI